MKKEFYFDTERTQILFKLPHCRIDERHTLEQRRWYALSLVDMNFCDSTSNGATVCVFIYLRTCMCIGAHGISREMKKQQTSEQTNARMNE